MTQSLCGLGLVDGPLGGELGWAEVAVGGVGSIDIVVDSPVLDDYAGLEEAVPLAPVEEFVAKAAVEALDPAFCRGEPGSMNTRSLNRTMP